jgi:hypothetical protein
MEASKTILFNAIALTKPANLYTARQHMQHVGVVGASFFSPQAHQFCQCRFVQMSCMRTICITSSNEARAVSSHYKTIVTVAVAVVLGRHRSVYVYYAKKGSLPYLLNFKWPTCDKKSQHCLLSRYSGMFAFVPLATPVLFLWSLVFVEIVTIRYWKAFF